LDLLHACLQPTKSLIDAFISLPWTIYFSIPYEFFVRLKQAIIILSKLLLFDCEGWDTKHVRNQVNLVEVLDLVCERFNETKKVFQANPLTMEHDDAFSKSARTLQDVRVWYVANLENESGQEATATAQEQNGAPGNQVEYSFGEMFWGDIMDDLGTFSAVSMLEKTN
jgi:hypothetical protein